MTLTIIECVPVIIQFAAGYLDQLQKETQAKRSGGKNSVLYIGAYTVASH